MAVRKSTGTKASTPSHKRQLSKNNETPTTASRSSKRLKESVQNTPASVSATGSTPKKSKYFEPDSDEDETEEEEEEEESGYEDDDNDDKDGFTEVSSSNEINSTSEEDLDSAEDEEEDTKPKKRGQKNITKKPASKGLGTTIIEAGKDLWRQGVKTGLGPGKQVFIEKPKPKGDGGVKYVPERIHPNTMAFLADLKKNNDREWLKMHDPDYRQSWRDWESFVDSLTQKISEVDETIPELPPKDLVFRIYRDVRFSSDPTPYKTHYSAAWSRTGRKGPYACYYVQLQPGGSFVGGGLWMPEAQPLALIRTDIDRRPSRFKRVLLDAGVRKQFLGAIPNDEKKAVKAFANQNAESALKTKPKGYEADHANIELLRLRSFTMGRKLKDEEVMGPQGLDRIASLAAAMTPFITYLNGVVMPDDAASSSEESEHDSISADA